jgi:hypothetical protein
MVSIIASLLVLLGLVALLVGSITFIIAAFRTSILWGLGVFLFGPVSIVYLVLHWSDAKKPFYLQLWGVGFVIAASLMAGGEPLWPLH